jgi:hypothetical protein
VVGAQRGDHDGAAPADPGERREQARVDAAGAQVDALARGEDDSRVVEQLANAGDLERRARGRAGRGAPVAEENRQLARELDARKWPSDATCAKIRGLARISAAPR